MRNLKMALLVVGSLLLVLLLPPDSSRGAGASDESHTEEVIRYESPARTYEVVFKGGYGIGGEVGARRPSEKQERAFKERLGYEVYECSDASNRCLTYLYSVFAVPKHALSVGMMYTSGGAHLRVEECLRDSGDSCQVALISSECGVALETGRCQANVSGDGMSTRQSAVTYFIFNEDIGVTAFGKSGVRIEGPNERLQVAKSAVTQLVLQGGVGLLKAAIPTVPSTNP